MLLVGVAAFLGTIRSAIAIRRPTRCRCDGEPRRSVSRSIDGAGLAQRAGVIALAGSIINVIAVYLALNAASGGSDTGPAAMLARWWTIPGDQQMFRSIREGTGRRVESRARRRLADAPALAARAVAPFAAASSGGEGAAVSGRGCGERRSSASSAAARSSQPAWLLEVQEPEPGLPPDPRQREEPATGRHHPSHLRVDAPLRRRRAGRRRPSAPGQRVDAGVFGGAESGVL